MVLVSNVINYNIFAKVKENVQEQIFRVFSYARETLRILGTRFKKEKIYLNIITINFINIIPLIFST